MNEFWYLHTVLRPVIIASVSGSLAAVALNPRATWTGSLSECFIGCAYAIYMSPALCAYFGIETDAYQNAIAFIHGVIGAIVLRALRLWLQKSGILERLFTKMEEKTIGRNDPS